MTSSATMNVSVAFSNLDAAQRPLLKALILKLNLSVAVSYVKELIYRLLQDLKLVNYDNVLLRPLC